MSHSVGVILDLLMAWLSIKCITTNIKVAVFYRAENERDELFTYFFLVMGSVLLMIFMLYLLVDASKYIHVC